MTLNLRKIDKWFDANWPLLLLLATVALLRIPNFFEPYWYGDEGIYLTLGTAMRHGLRLYAEIIDHKTPLIYYLAMVPSQFLFRTLLLGWMLATTTAFYVLAARLLQHKVTTFLTTLLFVLFTTLPWLEGNIPNGELFVMGFVIVAGALLTKTTLWQDAFQIPQKTKASDTLSNIITVIAGVFLGLGVLTKVPAIFDVAAFFTVIWFFVIRFLPQLFTKKQDFWITLGYGIQQGVLLMAGVLLPIIISIIYFVARGSGKAYLDYGLLYNFRYAGSWQLPFDDPFLLFWFSLPGKVLVAAVFILLLTVLSKATKMRFLFAASWSILAMVAALLSNRPYPHYFMQVVPPLALTLGVVATTILEKRKSLSSYLTSVGVEIIFTAFLAANLIGALYLLQFGLYPTVSYYTRWYKLVTGQISTQDYYQSFDSLMTDNYHAASIIKESPDPYLFIWGTNPMLYALTEKVPTGRFTVSFHIKDFDAYEETLAGVTQHQPEYIVVMKNETDAFPAFYDYLQENYIPNNNFSNFTLWKLL